MKYIIRQVRGSVLHCNCTHCHFDRNLYMIIPNSKSRKFSTNKKKSTPATTCTVGRHGNTFVTGGRGIDFGDDRGDACVQDPINLWHEEGRRFACNWSV